MINWLSAVYHHCVDSEEARTKSLMRSRDGHPVTRDPYTRKMINFPNNLLIIIKRANRCESSRRGLEDVRGRICGAGRRGTLRHRASRRPYRPPRMCIAMLPVRSADPPTRGTSPSLESNDRIGHGAASPFVAQRLGACDVRRGSCCSAVRAHVCRFTCSRCTPIEVRRISNSAIYLLFSSSILTRNRDLLMKIYA